MGGQGVERRAYLTAGQRCIQGPGQRDVWCKGSHVLAGGALTGPGGAGRRGPRVPGGLLSRQKEKRSGRINQEGGRLAWSRQCSRKSIWHQCVGGKTLRTGSPLMVGTHTRFDKACLTSSQSRAFFSPEPPHPSMVNFVHPLGLGLNATSSRETSLTDPTSGRVPQSPLALSRWPHCVMCVVKTTTNTT